MNVQNNDVTVEFTVRVPAGVRFIGHTVNGDVDGRRTRRPGLALQTVNGEANFSTSSYGDASTVNGSIRGSMGSARLEPNARVPIGQRQHHARPARRPQHRRAGGDRQRRHLDRLPAHGHRDASARAGSTGTIGGGGRSLDLETVNGSVDAETADRAPIRIRDIVSGWKEFSRRGAGSSRGYKPSLSIEITRECPLRCPGCYAYGDEHLGGDVTLRQVSDYKGRSSSIGFFELVDEHKPLHVSIVGGEPLVRFRELNTILPRLAERGIYTQLVTSAVRPIPAEWAQLRRLQIVVSIDGLQPEHDVRRTPATYDRILKHIVGHQITVHCTVTRQQVQRDGYLEEFLRFWSANAERRARSG